MNDYDCRVEADSVSPDGIRLTTLVVTFPRIVLAEFNTHRVFSRNSASSRAIPVHKRIAAVLEAPFIPRLTVAGKGMVSNDVVSDELQDEWIRDVKALARAACKLADKWSKSGHKQHVNRYLEPWSWTTVVVSSTEWANFLALRDHPEAAPEMQRVARLMRECLDASEPRHVKYTEWHVPFVTVEECATLPLASLLKVAVGRLARVSYETHDGKRDLQADIDLAERLASAKPPHASPWEHVATPAQYPEARRSNFRGWQQLRHLRGLG